MIDELQRLGVEDLKFAEELAKQLYAAEIDRKDKILASMTVATAPITVLVASVAFLANVTLDTSSDFLSLRPDVVVILCYILLCILLIFVCRTLFFYHRLLTGEYYRYLPDAGVLASNMAEIKRYCEAYALDDGAMAQYMRVNLVGMYTECAARSCKANDQRLIFRQGVFANVARAVLVVVASLIAVAVHRAQPHIWNPFTQTGRTEHGQPAPSPSATDLHPPATPGSAAGQGH